MSAINLSKTESQSAPWIFGYGSLIWRPDFEFQQQQLATITGWVRRFWQGSEDHRGTCDNPGRVVTLVPAFSDSCVGMAFQLCDHSANTVLDELDYREKNGYDRINVGLKLADGRCLEGITYIASEDNPVFLGDAPLAEIAKQICVSGGESGLNRDYLFELAKVFRSLGIIDAHIFELESAVRQIIDANAGKITG